MVRRLPCRSKVKVKVKVRVRVRVKVKVKGMDRGIWMAIGMDKRGLREIGRARVRLKGERRIKMMIGGR